MKVVKLFCLLFLCSAKLLAQDAVLISEGNFIRGEIKGTNYSSVAIMQLDQTLVQYMAKDIVSFLWNGETYVSKPMIINKKMEIRFFKLIESGVVNLYSYGERAVVNAVPQPRAKIRPSFNVGMGSGGMGGGMGGGITIGGGDNRQNQDLINTETQVRVAYFLERPGTGPMQEITLDPSKIEGVKTFLLKKITNNQDLTTLIKNAEYFDPKNLAAFVKTYNEGQK